MAMNIMDLPIGSECKSEGGAQYRIIRDERERKPGLGIVTVRVAVDLNGQTHRFIRGIEVEPLDH